jgi:hypothetical protein
MTPTQTSNGITQSLVNPAPLKVKLMIDHQFPDIELISPIHAGKGATCYPSHDQRVDAGSTTQARFSFNPTRMVSMGALMYKVQRKHNDQSNEDKTTCTQLFIIWEAKGSKEFRVVSDMIEHDQSYVWNRVGLMKLAERYELYNIKHRPIEETYLMYNNTVLMTSLNLTREDGCYKIELTLSETSMKGNTQRPWCIDLDR